MRLIDTDALETKAKTIYMEHGNVAIPTRVIPISDLHLTPTIDAEPVRHGRWVDRGDYVTTAYGSLDLKICSCCNAEVTLDGYDYYCPNCGAKMDGEDDGTKEKTQMSEMQNDG